MSEAPSSGKIAEIAARLLSDAAFIFTEPTGSAPTKVDMMRAARIELKAPDPWQLVFAVPMSLGRELAANLLGTEEGSDEAGSASGDAVGEMTNILAGALALEFEGSTSCSIGLPVISVESPSAMGTLVASSARVAHLTTESGSSCLVLLLRGARA